MKLSAFKNNALVAEVDLGGEVSSGAEAFFLIGRSKNCHLVLDDKQISREHAQINYVEGRWSISQLTQMGVILVNGMVCSEKELNSGDMIMLGPFMVRVFLNDNVTAVVPEQQNLEEEEALEVEGSDEVVQEEAFEVSDEDDVDEESFVREEPVEEDSADDNFSSEDNSDGFDDNSQNDSFESEDQFTSDDSGFDQLEGDDETEQFDDEGTKVLQTFARFELVIEGEYAPYDRFVVENGETVIGRDGKKCQIVLNDPEVSGTHASITKNNILCTLKDLQSGNGTILNGSRINQVELGNGDEFIIGSTTFTVSVASDLLREEEARLMPVEENQEIEVEEEVEVGADFGDGEFEQTEEGLVDFGDTSAVPAPKSLVGKFKLAWQDPGKRKKIIYGMVGLVLLWVMFGEEEKPQPKKKTKEQIAKELAAKKKQKDKKAIKTKKNHSAETLQQLEAKYLIANKLAETGKYEQAMVELDYIAAIDEDYKNTKGLMKYVKAGFEELEELERRKREEEQRKIRKEKIKKLSAEAEAATKERNVARAEALFAQILEMDPENLDIPTLRNELDAWKKEQERIALEKAQKEADRKRRLGQIAPGKKYFLQKEWHKAILKLEDFLEIDNMDEDLVREATQMLKEAKGHLEGEIAPRLGRARSLKEGKDDKGAYAQYKEILNIDPTNREALDEMNEIMDNLTKRARKVYRDALISESLSLFDEAKEKFNEVKQISPTDGEYYKKAEERLKDYLE